MVPRAVIGVKLPSVVQIVIHLPDCVMWSWLQYSNHRSNYSKSIGGGGQRAESAQGIIELLMESDFSLYLTPFLANMGGGSAQHWEGSGPPKLI